MATIPAGGVSHGKFKLDNSTIVIIVILVIAVVAISPIIKLLKSLFGGINEGVTGVKKAVEAVFTEYNIAQVIDGSVDSPINSSYWTEHASEVPAGTSLHTVAKNQVLINKVLTYETTFIKNQSATNIISFLNNFANKYDFAFFTYNFSITKNQNFALWLSYNWNNESCDQFIKAFNTKFKA